MSHKLLLTAGNAGCGYYALVKFAKESEIKECWLTARSDKKAQDAIASLVKETGKPREVSFPERCKSAEEHYPPLLLACTKSFSSSSERPGPYSKLAFVFPIH
jgi:hypothetical protein